MKMINVDQLVSRKRVERTSNGQLLPDDLLSEILEHLPVRSLLRFKCVSKSWYTMIKSPNFITNHLAKQQAKDSWVLMLWNYLPPNLNIGVFSFHDPESLTEICPNVSIPFMIEYSNYSPSDVQNSEPIYVLGPCNGLLVIIYEEHVRLCNPALRHCKLLPECPVVLPDMDHSYSYRRGQGFGITRTGDYKIVQMWTFSPHHEFFTQVHIYSLSTNCWKRIDYDPKDVPYGPHVGCGVSQVFFNGVCHWNAVSFPDHDSIPTPSAILSFDINTENFEVIEYPICLPSGCNFPILMVLSECFGFVRLSSEPLVEVWVMKEYGVKESWTKQFVRWPYPPNDLVPFNDEDWLLTEGLQMKDEFLFCALNKMDIMKFENDADVESMVALTYKESLISLDDVVKSAPLVELESYM